MVDTSTLNKQIVIQWDVKRSLSTSIFLIYNTFIILARYKGVHLSSVAVEAILEKILIATKKGAIIEYDSTASRYNYV